MRVVLTERELLDLLNQKLDLVDHNQIPRDIVGIEWVLDGDTNTYDIHIALGEL